MSIPESHPAAALHPFHANQVLPIHVSANKQRSPIVPIYQAWNTLSFVQVEKTPAKVGEPGSRVLIIDAGTAATGMQDLRPCVRSVLQQRLSWRMETRDSSVPGNTQQWRNEARVC